MGDARGIGCERLLAFPSAAESAGRRKRGRRRVHAVENFDVQRVAIRIDQRVVERHDIERRRRCDLIDAHCGRRVVDLDGTDDLERPFFHIAGKDGQLHRSTARDVDRRFPRERVTHRHAWRTARQRTREGETFEQTKRLPTVPRDAKLELHGVALAILEVDFERNRSLQSHALRIGARRYESHAWSLRVVHGKGRRIRRSAAYGIAFEQRRQAKAHGVHARQRQVRYAVPDENVGAAFGRRAERVQIR